ncbi:MAG: DUF1566 domain-containing protein [Deltaproteobacteria bacterium]|nr:DUF1566 domain-containing protein [Deltaproteobacteria bacterium]
MNNIQEVGAEQQSDNKYCTGCGTELVLTNKFCTKCGKKIVFVNKIPEIDISSVLSDKIDDVQADTKPDEDNGDQQVEMPLETEEKCLGKKFNYATAFVVIIAISIGACVINHYFWPEIISKAGETGRDDRFTAYSNGTVLDTRTNLMWAAKDNGSDITWANAKSYCDNYRGGGNTGWRMPTQHELAELYASGALGGLIKLTSYCPWASETRGSDAATFRFNSGERGWTPQSYDVTLRALPVRSGK